MPFGRGDVGERDCCFDRLVGRGRNKAGNTTRGAVGYATTTGGDNRRRNSLCVVVAARVYHCRRDIALGDTEVVGKEMSQLGVCRIVCKSLYKDPAQ